MTTRRPSHRQAWTPREDAVMRKRYPHEPTAATAAALQRSSRVVIQRARKLGLRKSQQYLTSPAACHRRWTAAEDRTLRRRYPHESTLAIAKSLGRLICVVYQRAAALGLHKTKAYMASPAACRLRRTGDEHPGKAFQYPKGNVPYNKGLRRPGWSPGRMRETQFKKGHGGRNPGGRYMPVGATRLCDGYVYRKIAETPTVPWTRNWKCEHLLIWEAANGPLPTGHAVAFRNGDRTDIRLDNLERITRAENMRRNSIHNYPKPIAETVQLIGALNRQIRRRTRAQEQDRRSA